MPRTLWTVVALCGASIAFDGYDLVVYGTTVPSLLAEWQIGPAEAGRLGSYALIGMLFGALLTGTIADSVGRRRTMIACVTWFSVFTALCAFAPSPEVFGALRLIAGIGLGGLMPTAAALVVEYAPPGKQNLTYAMMQSGYAVGGILAAAIAIPVIPFAVVVAGQPVLLMVYGLTSSPARRQKIQPTPRCGLRFAVHSPGQRLEGSPRCHPTPWGGTTSQLGYRYTKQPSTLVRKPGKAGPHPPLEWR